MPFDLTIWQVAALIAKVAVYGGSAFAIGTVLFHLLVSREGMSSDRKLVLTSACLAILAGGVQVLIQSGRLMDDGMSGVMDTEMWALVAGTPLGTSVGLRTIGLLLICVAAMWSFPLWPVSISGVALTALSFPMVGHATGDPSWILTVSIALHVLVLSFWLGGLTPLHHAARHMPPETAGRLAEDFGRQAVIAVALLAATGGWVAYTLVGSVENLISSQYGLTLLGKLLVVTTLLGLAALNKFRLVPSLTNGAPDAAVNLRRSIRVEAIAFVTIFAATAILTTILALPTMGEANR